MRASFSTFQVFSADVSMTINCSAAVPAMDYQLKQYAATSKGQACKVWSCCLSLLQRHLSNCTFQVCHCVLGRALFLKLLVFCASLSHFQEVCHLQGPPVEPIGWANPSSNICPGQTGSPVIPHFFLFSVGQRLWHFSFNECWPCAPPSTHFQAFFLAVTSTAMP